MNTPQPSPHHGLGESSEGGALPTFPLSRECQLSLGARKISSAALLTAFCDEGTALEACQLAFCNDSTAPH